MSYTLFIFLNILLIQFPFSNEGCKYKTDASQTQTQLLKLMINTSQVQMQMKTSKNVFLYLIQMWRMALVATIRILMAKKLAYQIQVVIAQHPHL